MNELFGKWIVWHGKLGRYFQCPICGIIYCVHKGFNPFVFAWSPCPKCGAENGGITNEPKSIR